MELMWDSSDSDSECGTICVTDTAASVADDSFGSSPPRRIRDSAGRPAILEEVSSFSDTDGTPTPSPSPSGPPADFGTVIRLDLEDFKSYRGKVSIGDFARFTAIIGPNGCGKSNLMDAISFVLCVSSSMLRGLNLKDLIYKSRDQGEPAPSSAAVALTLKGAHHPVVFRREITGGGSVSYYVDGRSIPFRQYKDTLREYRINTLGCTGLIFQGAVNDIASRSPVELTRLFETISGSSLYAKPYTYTKERLERRRMEQRDLAVRKKSLQQELRQYRAMVSSGVDYDAVLSQYKRVEAEVYARRFHLLERKFQQYKRNYENVFREHSSLSKRWASMQQKRDDLERERARLYFEQGELHRCLQDKSQRLVAKKASMREYCESKASLEQRVSELDVLRQSMESDIDRLRRESEELSAQEARLRSAVAAGSAEIDELKRATVKLTPAQRVRYDSLLQSFHKAASSVRIRMNMRRSKLDHLSGERDRFSIELASLRKHESKLLESSRPHTSMFESLCTRLRETKDSVDLLAMSQSRLEHERSQVSERRSLLQSEKDVLDEHLKTLNVAKVEYRQILRRRQYSEELVRTIPGVHGEVLSLCEITNACYHDGIMAALSTRGHTIVTDSLSSISECICKLKRDKVFKRDFLPLDSLRPGKSDNRVRITELLRSRASKVQFTFAIDCLVFQRKYATLFEHLLGDTIIVASLEDAERVISLDSSQSVSFNVVTQRGQLITRDRTIIIDSAIYSKRSQIELEIAEFGRLTLKSERLDHDIHALTKRLSTIESSLQDTVGRIQKHGRAIDLLRMKVDFASKHKDACESQLRDVSAKVKAACSRLSQLEAELGSLESEHDRDRRVLDGLQRDHFKDLNSELGVDDVYGLLSARLDSVAHLESQLERKRALLSRCESDRLDLESRIEHLSDSVLSDTTAQHQSALADLHALLKGNQVLFSELSSLEKDVACDRARFSDYSRRIERCQERIKFLQYEYQCTTSGTGTPPCDDSADMDIDSDNRHIAPLGETKENISSRLLELLQLLRSTQQRAVELCEECRLRNVACEISLPEGLASHVRDPNSTEHVTDFPLLLSTNLLSSLNASAVPSDSSCDDPDSDASDATDLFPLQESINKLESHLQNLRRSLSASRECDDAGVRLQRAQVESDRLDEEIESTRAECANLEADFDRIKRERTSLFMNCFHSVKNLVGPIYRSLSAQDGSDELSGGSAFLSLDDDSSGSVSEPFLCSIRYNTMPPMKKFMDISLQSGGEKALSSLALLLALHSFRRSPFVVLDEIDANLDNVKVQSLVSFLRRSAFQVIIISLKAKLFSSADVLVGVYSQHDRASSGCVVLSLEEYESAGDSLSSP